MICKYRMGTSAANHEQRFSWIFIKFIHFHYSPVYWFYYLTIVHIYFGFSICYLLVVSLESTSIFIVMQIMPRYIHYISLDPQMAIAILTTWLWYSGINLCLTQSSLLLSQDKTEILFTGAMAERERAFLLTSGHLHSQTLITRICDSRDIVCKKSNVWLLSTCLLKVW